jgi:hypothetical protein
VIRLASPCYGRLLIARTISFSIPRSNPCKSPELQPLTIYRMPDFCLNKPQHQAKAKEPSPSRTPWNHDTTAGTEGKPGATSSEEPCAGTSKTPTLISTYGVLQNVEDGLYICPAHGFSTGFTPYVQNLPDIIWGFGGQLGSRNMAD